jgi:serine protease Do
MKLKQILFTVAISAVSAFAVVWGYATYLKSSKTYAGQVAGETPANYAKRTNLFGDDAGPGGPADFTTAAATATPTVVHIKTKTNAKQINNNLPKVRQQSPFGDMDMFGGDDIFEQFFGKQNRMIPEQRASGSGVIISEDGLIITNNHVISNADEVKVTLSNRKTYTAKVIGADPAYDLAVLKIEAKGLPYLLYGNSDDAKIGQWVLAIGYPLNLDATVTAGIISAKARALGLNKDKQGASGVESFIQTDAAVNSGNSGGALISTDAKLIGINSAIASPTGYYSGYSYAIPVNIVKKVVDDIIKFGTVQRAYIGVQYAPTELTDEERKRGNIPADITGIYVMEATKDGGAYAAGLRNGDVITKVNNVIVYTGPEMQEQVSRYKPGDKISITFTRDGAEKTVEVSLKNKAGNYDVVKTENSIDVLGADLANLDAKKLKEYGISGGVLIKKVKEGGIIEKQSRMRDGFVIIKVNEAPVNNVEEFKKAVGQNKDIVISGFYPGYEGLYEYPFSLENE